MIIDFLPKELHKQSSLQARGFEPHISEHLPNATARDCKLIKILHRAIALVNRIDMSYR